ncbi:MAG: pyridoxal 5'-phosphate synthase glutaminase subunit PdxT [Christensenellaceae bacterium]
MKIAVLALQGAFIEHEKMLAALNVETVELRKKSDLDQSFDGLIIPGGESTVQGKLLKELELFDGLRRRIEGGLPVFGTCAGLILLAKKIENDERIHFATMDIAVRRNAYGRQLGSFYEECAFEGLGNVPMTFIRAPYIETVSGGARALATCRGKIVAARQGNQLVTAFHPELSEDVSVHRYFIDMIEGRR